MENTNAYLDPQQFLESKYSESFRPYSMITDSIDQPYIEYFFIADSNPNVFNRVIYDGIDFYDDYFGTLIKEEYLQIVSSIINQFDKTAKIVMIYLYKLIYIEVNIINNVKNCIPYNPK